MDDLDRTISAARNAVGERNREVIQALLTLHGTGADEEIDRLLERGTIEELLPFADETQVDIVLAYVLMARAVRLGANTDLATLTPNERQKHEQALTQCEESYVQARALYEASDSPLTTEQREIIGRLVEVKIKR